MVVGIEDRRRDLVARVSRCVREHAGCAGSEQAERFVRELYAHVPPDDLLTDDPHNLCGAALALWHFAQERPAGTSRVRVYNPTAAESGWVSSHTVIEVVNDDMPFLVDSVTAALDTFQAAVHLVIHPIVAVERDEEGRITRLHGVMGAPNAAAAESWMQIRISEQPPATHEEIRANLEAVLDEVRVAVQDWPRMRERCIAAARRLRDNPSAAVPKDEVEEACAFLEWIADDNFVFLGYREYAFEGEGEDTRVHVRPEEGLGILREERRTVFGGIRKPGGVPKRVWERIRTPDLLRITKGNRRSRVHRPVYMDTIAVKWIDDDGMDREESLFVGLFTSEAYSRNPRNIPLLRRKVSQVLDRAGLVPGSHDARTLRHIVESFPRDELFQSSEDELFEIAVGTLGLQERRRIALFVRPDPFERFVSCLIYVPRERYDTALRQRLQAIVEEAYQGRVRDYYILLTDAPLAGLRFIVQCRPGQIPDVDPKALQARLREAGRSAIDRLETALIEARGEEEGLRTLRRFAEGFPASYWERFDPEQAVVDIGHIERAIRTHDVCVHLYRLPGAAAHEFHIKSYSDGAPAPLSVIVPMLEDMGLVVKGERPYEIRPAGLETPVWIRDFDLALQGDAPVDLDEVRGVFEEAVTAVTHGELEDDGFNALVLRARLTARQVTVLRAYARYLRQAQIPYSQTYMERTLAGNPEIARLLVTLFETRFDPDRREGADERAAAVVEEIRRRLDDVQNLDEDRMIRRFLNLVEVTLRTNWYQRDANGSPKPYLAFKLDSRRVRDLPLPLPLREIFVYSPRMEGIHLRGGLVARGGIRWSDRLEDFRTEVLGLMKAQMVKNAVIVPVGSKGGFVMKRPPEGEVREEVVACYRILIRGLLDLTDNLVGNAVVPPPDVVRYDGDDPYLVVAADKGTATFSDVANGIAAEYGFWLDDAFASGGSAGYDHKKIGITARGGWECVKRHFREMGKDIQEEPFTVVGVGDMAGDVFGNGMLLSRGIRLVGAFNHQHIFIDPDPDPARSLAERERLFALERSSWADYDLSTISEGGGIFLRSAKAIRTTPAMRRRFEIEAEEVTPNELIQALLRAQVELMWFAGIGTFVKADAESNADAGDHTNDAVRIDARELRAQVVGEGANLGMTQRARIQYALQGGRLNTDAIDNSAGVDCSDHEVNIKILLGAAVQSGAIPRSDRDGLLRDMTDEVGELCLRDNYLQSQAITVTHRMGVHLLDRLARFMRQLEREGLLNRTIERLPDDETIAERMQRGLGFTRPELALLLAYAKIALSANLLQGDLPDDPDLVADLQSYFPAPLRERFAAEIRAHRLRREIVSTVLTNELVNRVGIAFVHEVREKTGLPDPDVARGYVVSRETFGMRDLWRRIEALDNRVPASLQAAMLAECGRAVERATVWFLRECDHPLRVRQEVERYAPGVRAFTEALLDLLSENDTATYERRRSRYVEEGAPEDLADRVARLSLLGPALDIVRIADEAGRRVPDVARLYAAVGARFGLDWLRTAASRLSTDTAWDKRAVSAIVDDLFSHQSTLTRESLVHARDGMTPEEVIDRWAETRTHQVVRTEQLLAELQSMGSPNMAMLAVANRQLKSMAT